MFISILTWIAGWILNYLAGKATTALAQAAADFKLAQERGAVNDANTQAYEEAKSRAERIQAATYLLNRESPPTSN